MSLVTIGNDVVDLDEPECVGKSKDLRFIRRVFGAREQEWILNSSKPDEALWALWAGKEAGFKAMYKLSNGCRFFPIEFDVCIKNSLVHYRGHEIPIIFDIDPARIHCVALGMVPDDGTAGDSANLAALQSRIRCSVKKTGPSVSRSQESLRAQNLADELSKACHYRQPTRDEAHSPFKPCLSVSHHGEYVAAAILAES